MQKLTHARGVTGVYVIVRVATGESYIGSSGDIGQRWYNHRGKLRRGAHTNPRLQAAWTEHGEAAFRFVIVERLAEVADLRLREQEWLTAGETHVPGIGYNLSWSTNGVGWRYNDEQRARLSAALKGKVRSPEQCAAMSRPCTDAGRERMAAVGRAGKGRKKTAAHLRKIGLPQRGSGNHRARLTEAYVVEIMWRLANGERAIDLAAEYGIRPDTVGHIKAGRAWRHITVK